MKKAAMINDLSGIGRCSLNVAISILSHLRIQTCPLPTAILSNQTGFKSFSFLDFTPYMKEYYLHWKKLGYEFDAIYTGFLGSKDQVETVLEFVKLFKKEKTLVLIDPVMGDNGKLYSIYDESYPDIMKKLIGYADVITPNMTEFELLTGYDIKKDGLNEEKIKKCAKELSELGPKQIVITGLVEKKEPNSLTNMGFDFKTGESFKESTAYNHKTYSGTGDILASIVCGYLVQGYSLKRSVQIATHFISKAIKYTEKFHIDTNEGIMYEAFLKEMDIDETDR